MRKQKYIGTNTMSGINLRAAISALLNREIGSQVHIVVKATGRKNAEKVCSQHDLTKYTKFRQDYYSETENENAIAACDRSESGIAFSAVCTSEYITLEEVEAYLGNK